MRVMINEAKHEVGNEIILKGWVHRIKSLKSVVFIVLKDRTGMVQCVCSHEQFNAMSLTLESVVELRGSVSSSKNDLQPVEVHIQEMKVLNAPAEPLPITVNTEELEVQLDTLLNNRVLAMRHPKEKAIFKIQSAIANAFRTFLEKNDFTEIFTPKLVKEGAEGGANVFELKYFNQKAYLAQSPQFYKQMMVISGLERVFELAPVFRAEQHSTRRHINEYVSMDVEMGFIEDFNELIVLETQLLNHIMNELNDRCAKELALLEVATPEVPSEIPKMKLSEAIGILKSNYGKIELEGDLDPEGERLIGDYIKETTGSDFVFLTHYPRAKRPMYTKPSGDTETEGFDLLYKGLEITTGGLRIHELKDLKASMILKGLNPENYSTYLEAFKYGAPPHGGFAIGLERLTAQLLGFENIRRTTLFPRDVTRLTP